MPTHPSADQTLATKVAALRERFRGRLAGRLEALANALSALSRAFDRAALAEVVADAHRIRGTAGTYGIPEATEVAALVEDRLAPLLAAPAAAPPNPAVFATLEDRVTDLADALREEPTPSPTPPATPRDQPPLLVVGRPALTAHLAELARELDVPLVTRTTDATAPPPRPLWGALIEVGESAEEAARTARSLRALDGCEALPVAFLGASEEALRDLLVHAGVASVIDEQLDKAQLRQLLADFEQVRRARLPTILVVDDDEAFAEAVSEILSARQMRVVHQPDPELALQAMKEHAPDLVILDLQMKPIDGFEVARRIRAEAAWRTVPLLFTTAAVSDEVRLACYRAGADDYIPKPVLPEELDARIRVRLERQRLHRERADVDPLTGLANRRAFTERFEAALARLRRSGEPLSLALIDLDRFKRLNDRHGHLAGDRALEHVGRLLRRSARHQDLRGRWGGEEFVLALVGVGADAAQRIVERILAEVRAESLDGAIPLSFTAGVASFPTDASDLRGLLQVADARLYRGKATGRGKVVSTDEGDES